MKTFLKLKKLVPGDNVAVVSPSSGVAGTFPWVYNLGVERLRNKFNLVPIEYPTTTVNSSPRKRAIDLMRAYADPKISAVISTIGGSDQIEVIKYLDPKIFTDNPKPFFGYSDNTHFHLFLWSLSIPSFYGGSIMNQFAMSNNISDITVDSLNKCLFQSGKYEMQFSDRFCDIDNDWTLQQDFNKPKKYEKGEIAKVSKWRNFQLT